MFHILRLIWLWEIVAPNELLVASRRGVSVARSNFPHVSIVGRLQGQISLMCQLMVGCKATFPPCVNYWYVARPNFPHVSIVIILQDQISLMCQLLICCKAKFWKCSEGLVFCFVLILFSFHVTSKNELISNSRYHTLSNNMLQWKNIASNITLEWDL